MLKRKRYDEAAGCPVAATLDLIDGKWKGVILYHLLGVSASCGGSCRRSRRAC